MTAAQQAVGLDQVGAYRGLVAAVDFAANELDGGGVSAATWSAVAAAVGPGPLAALVDRIQSSSA